MPRFDGEHERDTSGIAGRPDVPPQAVRAGLGAAAALALVAIALTGYLFVM